MAIGGETTGTTLTASRIRWELQLLSDLDREFADRHNKQSIVVTGTVRKVAGIETEPRWIIDVEKLAVADAQTFKEGTRIKVLGKLQSTGPQCSGGSEMAIHANGQVWPLLFSSESRLKPVAETSIGQTVQLTGDLETAAEDDLCAPGFIRVKAINRPATTQDP